MTVIQTSTDTEGSVQASGSVPTLEGMNESDLQAQRRRVRNSGLVTLVGLAFVAAVGFGWGHSSSSSDAAAPAPTVTVAAPAVTVTSNTDDAFFAKLTKDAPGLPATATVKDATIKVAHAICDAFDSGLSSDQVTQIVAGSSLLPRTEQSAEIADSVASYCPQHASEYN